MIVPLSTAAVIAAIAIAATAVGILIVIVARRSQTRIAAEQRAGFEAIASEVRPIAGAVLELVRLTRGRPAPPPDEDPLDCIERIKAEIEDEPGYTPEHIRADLPEECDRITWDTPDGPVTAYRHARTRTSGRYRVRGYKGLLALPILGTLWRGLTSNPAVGVSMASVGAIAAAPAALPAIVHEQQQPPADGRPAVPDVYQRPAAPVASTTPTPTATATVTDDAEGDQLAPVTPSPTARSTATAVPAAPTGASSPAPTTTPSPTPDPTTAPSPTTGPPAPASTTRPSTDGGDRRPGQGHGRPDGPDHPRHNGHAHGRGR